MIDLKKKYIRNTHINGEYRQDMKEIWDKIPDTFSGFINLLDPHKPMDVYDILSASYDYARCYPLDNNTDVETHPNVLPAILELLVNFNMIKVVEEPKEEFNSRYKYMLQNLSKAPMQYQYLENDPTTKWLTENGYIHNVLGFVAVTEKGKECIR